MCAKRQSWGDVPAKEPTVETQLLCYCNNYYDTSWILVDSTWNSLTSSCASEDTLPLGIFSVLVEANLVHV